MAACRIGADATGLTSAVGACGGLLGCPVRGRRGARARRRSVAWDDGRHWGTSRLGGS